MSRSLKELTDAGLFRLYRQEVADANFAREFAELPPPRGGNGKPEQERYALALARCAAVRRHGSERTPPVLMSWPFPDPYDEALRDLDKRLAAVETREAKPER
jgi:hypothetical protein